MLSAALVLMVVVPAFGAVVAGALKGDGPRWALSVGVAALVVLIGIYAALAAPGYRYHAAVGTLPWLDAMLDGPVFGVMLDPLAAVMLLVATVIGLFTVLYSTHYLREKNREHATGHEGQARYYFWLLLFLASMVGVAVSPNFLQLLIFWELTTLCSWALISFYQDERSLRSGFKALLMTQAGGAFFLVAVLILFVSVGSVEFTALARLPDGLRLWVFILLMIAAWAKAAQVPFHTWLPDAMAAPTPISAYLHAAAMVKAGVYLMARSVSAGWAVPPAGAIALGVMALATMFIALSYYFVQDDLKRLLAYSTIAHLGYVLLGVALGGLGSIIAFRGGVLHIVCHGFSKATLFFCAGALAYVTGTRSIAALGGLARSMPLTATAFFVGVLAVAGVPPFACFWSKFMILAGAIELRGGIGPVLVVLVLVESLVSFAWMLYVGQKVFLGPVTRLAEVHSDPPPAMGAVLLLLVLACLLAPAIGIPLVEMIGR
ncbi:MAG: oxidoreductase [Gemmatimonadota bacterium]|nr:MAG: oxidoreductase [Gemmatimonadota bacterium]